MGDSALARAAEHGVMDTSGLFFRPGAMNALETLDPEAAAGHGDGHIDTQIDAPPGVATVELLGNQLRAEGLVDLGNWTRVSDYVNFLTGFFTIRDVTLLSRLGEPTRLTFPDLRVRLDDITIVGQRDPGPQVDPGDRYIPKERRRLVLTTVAHIIYGHAYVHEQASMTAFVDATDPRFIPMTNVRVRWLADRRLAGRYPFALIHRSHIVGVATEISGGLSLLRGRDHVVHVALEEE
jgi:hypothetical protein